MATPQPPWSGPSSASAGSRTSSRNTSSNSLPPVIWRNGPHVDPGCVHVDEEERDPRVRAGRRVGAGQEDAPVGDRPLEHHTFGPVTTQLSPSRSAFVRERGQVAAGPGLGEQLAPDLVGPEDAREVLGLLRRRCRRRGASRRSGRSPTMLIHGGTWASAHSRTHAAVCSGVSPRPRCSSGQWIPAQPASRRTRCQARPSSTSSGGQDRAVVAGRLPLVLRQPPLRRVSEVADVHQLDQDRAFMVSMSSSLRLPGTS